MQAIDSGSCRPSSHGPGEAEAAQGTRGFRGSPQDRADQIVRSTVLSDLGGGSNGRHGSGIQGIAAAIFKTLSTSGVTGTDMPDDVLKKVEQSLHTAAQKLADRGVDAKTIDATIDRFRSQLAGALDKLGGTAGSGSPGSTSSGTSGSSGSSGDATTPPSTTPPATAPTPSDVTSVTQSVAREVRQERGAIDLVTAEGDKVSIRFRSKEVVTGSVTQTTQADGTKTTATSTSLFSRAGVKIEVDGNLNADELAAINNLLGKVDEIATKFFSGDVQSAFSAAASLNVSSDQIASYQLDLTYSRKVAAAAWGVTRVGAPDPSSIGTQPPALPPADNSTTPTAPSSGAATNVAASTASNVAASTASGTAIPSAPDTATSAPTDASTSDTPASGTPPATTPPATARKTITDFIGDVLSKLGSVTGAGRFTFSAHWKLNVLTTALQTLQPAKPTTPAEEAAAKNTQLLGDSLQKAAAG